MCTLSDRPAFIDNYRSVIELIGAHPAPQAYLPSDLDMFFANFSPALVGQRPIFDSIDGGLLQTEVESFDYNGESVSTPVMSTASQSLSAKRISILNTA
jgi:hypothetical protein